MNISKALRIKRGKFTAFNDVCDEKSYILESVLHSVVRGTVMEKVKVTRKYQVTIPRKIRERVGIEIGDELLVSENGRTVILEKPMDLEALAGSWTHIDSTTKFMEDVREMWKTWKLK